MPSFETCRVSPNVIMREEEAGNEDDGVGLILYVKSRDRDLF